MQKSQLSLVASIKVGDLQAFAYGQMNEPLGTRDCVALSNRITAEHLRDREGQNMLLFVDNIFRSARAGYDELS